MTTRLATARSRLPVAAMLAIVGVALAVVAVFVALYLARARPATPATTTLLVPTAGPSDEAAPVPPAVLLAETVVGAPAAGWALVRVPPGRIPRRVSLSRSASGRASVWAVEAGDDALRPVLTVLLRPGEGEGTATSESSAASLGPLPSYHEAEEVLVVFHAAGEQLPGPLPEVIGVEAE